MTGTYGHTSQPPFAFYDHADCCWKTSQGTLISGLATCSPTWPDSGMTHDGAAYQLPMSAHRTAAVDSSSKRDLLPTPTVSDRSDGGFAATWRYLGSGDRSGFLANALAVLLRPFGMVPTGDGTPKLSASGKE